MVIFFLVIFFSILHFQQTCESFYVLLNRFIYFYLKHLFFYFCNCCLLYFTSALTIACITSRDLNLTEKFINFWFRRRSRMNTAGKKCCTENNEKGKTFYIWHLSKARGKKYWSTEHNIKVIEENILFSEAKQNTQTFSMYFTWKLQCERENVPAYFPVVIHSGGCFVRDIEHWNMLSNTRE